MVALGKGWICRKDIWENVVFIMKSEKKALLHVSNVLNLFPFYFTLLGLECAFLVGSFYFEKPILEKNAEFLLILKESSSSLSILACIPILNVDIYLAAKRNIPKHL